MPQRNDMSHGFVNKPGWKYVLSCSLVWAVALPLGTFIGWKVGHFITRLQPFPFYVELDWFPTIGLMLGGALSGAFTLRGLQQWIPDISRRQFLITGLGWALAFASLFVLSILIASD
jgi:hypothetical protein